MISRMRSNFGQIGSPTKELSALECLKNILCGKRCLIFFVVVFDLILLILAVNEMSLDEFEFWPDLTTDYGVV